MTVSNGLAWAIGDASSGGGPLHVASLTYDLAGGNVFTEALPQTPDVAVVVKSYGGSPPDSGLPYNQAILQIIVRGDEDPWTALELWDDIFDVLQGATHQTFPDGTQMIAILVQQAGPVNIGPDINGRHRFSMNLTCEVVNATVNRPAP